MTSRGILFQVTKPNRAGRFAEKCGTHTCAHAGRLRPPRALGQLPKALTGGGTQCSKTKTLGHITPPNPRWMIWSAAAHLLRLAATHPRPDCRTNCRTGFGTSDIDRPLPDNPARKPKLGAGAHPRRAAGAAQVHPQHQNSTQIPRSIRRARSARARWRALECQTSCDILSGRET